MDKTTATEKRLLILAKYAKPSDEARRAVNRLLKTPKKIWVELADIEEKL